ncbi:hypothetical protein Q2941_33845 [Bradyrhizobium sp. UFLA05-153]
MEELYKLDDAVTFITNLEHRHDAPEWEAAIGTLALMVDLFDGSTTSRARQASFGVRGRILQADYGAADAAGQLSVAGTQYKAGSPIEGRLSKVALINASTVMPALPHFKLLDR